MEEIKNERFISHILEFRREVSMNQYQEDERSYIVAYCRSCGAPVSEGENLCQKCKGILSVQKCMPLVTTNEKYYLENFSNMVFWKRKTSWNWSAFWFAPWWFIYRKMYSVGITYLLISMVLSFLGALSIRFLPLGLLLEIVAKIILGRFGNWIYLKSLENRLAELQRQPVDKPDDEQRRIMSGVSGGAVALALGVWVALTMLIRFVANAF